MPALALPQDPLLRGPLAEAPPGGVGSQPLQLVREEKR